MQRSLPTLNDAEARVLGVLIEKALTTPDQYPLTINAIVNGCNQKSNRLPVTSFVEAEVVVALQGLVPKALAGRVMGAGGRVERFRHTANATLDLDDARLGVIAELLMRGPQTSSELRARVSRMVPTPELAELNERLDHLISREMITRVPPASGSRTGRVMQLLAPDLHVVEAASAVAPAVPSAAPAVLVPSPIEQRVVALEAEVRSLRSELDQLRLELGS